MSGNPQIEDGYTKIANELLEALAKAMAQGIITARERAVIDWIIRYTYGYQEKNGYFHTSFIAKKLGLSMSWVSQILKRLEQKKIIVREGSEIMINKHYLEWSKYLEPSKYLEQSKQSLEPSKQCLDCSKQSTPTSIDENKSEETPKENIYKKNIYKENNNISKGTNQTPDLQNSFSNNLKEKNFKEPTPPQDMPPLPKVAGKKKDKKMDKKMPDELQEVLQEVGVEKKPVDKKEVLKLIGAFCDVMKYPFNHDTIAKNYQYAKELLQDYTIEEVIISIQQGIEIYKREGKKTPAVFIPTLASVKTMIHVWLAEAKKQQERRKNEF